MDLRWWKNDLHFHLEPTFLVAAGVAVILAFDDPTFIKRNNDPTFNAGGVLAIQ